MTENNISAGFLPTSEKKKVLIFSLAYRPLIGGAEIALEEITKRISNYEFHLITARFDAKNLPYEKLGNVFVYRVGWGIKWDKYLFFLLAYFKAVALEAKHKFPIVWGMMANYAALAALLFKWSYDVKYLLTEQSGDSDEFIRKRTWFWRPLYKQVYKQADIIQVISQWLAERARSFEYQKEIKVVPNGFDGRAFRQKPTAQDKGQMRERLRLTASDKVIITVSRLVEKNGLADLIGALVYLPVDYKLLIVGEGPLRPVLEQLVAKLKVASRVIFAGTVANHEVYQYLNLAEVFCRPSLSEGFGNVFVEAMAAGLPVIATDVGGLKDFLIDGETGLVCQVNNPQDIAAKVKKLEEPRLKDRLVANGLKLSAKYDWDNIAGQIKEILDSL